MKKKKILLLGSTGKMGVALKNVFENDYLVICKNSRDFDAFDFNQVTNLVKETQADIVISTVAYVGIDRCEKEPEKALRLNTLYPKLLAELSNKMGFLLVHFSTDAVFADKTGKRGFYTEKACPRPLNMYGLSKHSGDCFIQAIASKYYIFRISVLFGETTKNNQFVERMLQRVREGQMVLDISSDIISSPSYSKDIARQIKEILEESPRYGLYHVANDGSASLYDLMKEIAKNMELNVRVNAASYKDFPHIGIKNTYTPIRSEKIPSLRPWQEAVKEYCMNLNKEKG